MQLTYPVATMEAILCDSDRIFGLLKEIMANDAIFDLHLGVGYDIVWNENDEVEAKYQGKGIP